MKARSFRSTGAARLRARCGTHFRQKAFFAVLALATTWSSPADATFAASVPAAVVNVWPPFDVAFPKPRSSFATGSLTSMAVSRVHGSVAPTMPFPETIAVLALAPWPEAASLPGIRSARASSALQPVVRDAATRLVERYISALQRERYDDAYALLNESARQYYRDARNFGSIYAADGYRLLSFRLLGSRGDDRHGRVYFARETARFRDHAHDTELTVTATVPVGALPGRDGWSIKDPGHPWRAFAANAFGTAGGIRVSVKKMSFFARRIEAVVTIANGSTAFVTALPYGKSLLRDSDGHLYHPLETRDWSLTDKLFFSGLRLAPNAQYTGMLAFTCGTLGNRVPIYALTFAPLLADGADAPFTIDVGAIASAAAPAPGSK